jgi:hypothetical protein
MNLTGRPIPQKPDKAPDTLRDAARGEACTLRLVCCNHDPETTVLAHLRFFGWAGVAQKPDNLLAVFACSACHDALDMRTGAAVEFEDILRALGETLMRHKASGRITVK